MSQSEVETRFGCVCVCESVANYFTNVRCQKNQILFLFKVGWGGVIFTNGSHNISSSIGNAVFF